MKSIQKLSNLLLISIFLLTSCNKWRKDTSNTTGWSYNDPENGAFEVSPYVEQQTGPGLVLIEGGRFTMGRVEQDVMYDWNNFPRTVTVTSFYMDETEVRNVDYREYLYWTSRVYVSFPEVYQNALPDTLCWRRRLAYNEPYVEYYFRHPAYHDYPVVGVSWVQADKYCAWRSDRVNEQILVDEGIYEHDPEQKDENNFVTEAYLAGQYEGVVRKNLPDLRNDSENGRPVRMEDGIFLPRYRLPTEAEWEYAAMALLGNSVDERIYTRKIYPWNGHWLRNDGRVDGKNFQGLLMANFKRGRGDMMGVAGYLNDNATITNRVDSYWPNDFGLYCMAGNVNEWVGDVYRQMTFVDFEDMNPYRGNIFQVIDKDNQGVAKPKDKYGRIKKRNMTPEECMHRVNYTRAYNINYKDGDVQSSPNTAKDPDWKKEDPDPKGNDSGRMYYQGRGENSIGITSLVNDHSRVYKGGGWRDRAYWLSPGARRYLDENKSSDDIGFRCAMIRVGDNPGNF